MPWSYFDYRTLPYLITFSFRLLNIFHVGILFQTSLISLPVNKTMAKLTKNRLRKLLAKFKHCLHLRPTPPTPFRFLDLPGEIRNIIYRHVLTYKKSSASYYAPDRPRLPYTLDLGPNILLACKRTFEEGSSILYGENFFHVHPSFLTKSIMPAMTRTEIDHPHIISKVRRFHTEVCLNSGPYHSPRQLKEAFSGMDDLEIHVFQTIDGEFGTWLLEAYTEIRRVRRARVYGYIDKELARRLERCMQSDEGVEHGPWEW